MQSQERPGGHVVGNGDSTGHRFCANNGSHHIISRGIAERVDVVGDSHLQATRRERLIGLVEVGNDAANAED